MGAVSKWDARKDDIQRMVNARMTDGEIGDVYGVNAPAIWVVRKRLKIRTKIKRGLPTLKEVFSRSGPEVEPLVGITYTDESGLTVTRYPARFAEGVLRHGDMVMPKRIK